MDENSDSIERIYFKTLSENQARTIFNEIDFPITDKYEEILNTKADEIDLFTDITYFTTYEDVAVRLDVRKVGETGIRTLERSYYMNILYNEDMFKDFTGIWLP